MQNNLIVDLHKVTFQADMLFKHTNYSVIHLKC